VQLVSASVVEPMKYPGPASAMAWRQASRTWSGVPLDRRWLMSMPPARKIPGPHRTRVSFRFMPTTVSMGFSPSMPAARRSSMTSIR
jgi:hypothetical protein